MKWADLKYRLEADTVVLNNGFEIRRQVKGEIKGNSGFSSKH